MFTIYISQQEVHRCGTWASVKAYMLATGNKRAFVTVGVAQQWNVKLTDRNMLLKSRV